MKFHLKGRELLNAEIISPDMPYAKFEETVDKATIKKMVSSMNHGWEMLLEYQKLRDEKFHIQSVYECLSKMEKIWNEWQYENYKAARKEVGPNKMTEEQIKA